MRSTLIAGAVGAAIGLGVAATLSGPPAAADENLNKFQSLELFGDIFERVRGSYVEELEDKELVEKAVNGMLSALDPHSSYLPPQQHEEMREQTRGEFGGLGIEVTMENGFVKVVAPIDDTPAARAGLQANDYVTHLDGEAVLGLTLSEAVERMRGEIGTDITLTVLREGADEPFDVTITRDKIKILPVRARAEGDVGYVRITTFNRNTTDELTAKVDKLKDEIGADAIRGYVIDLRNNPGGLLDQAIGVSDAFLDKGEIVSTRGREARSAERYNATEGDLTDGKPIVVLVNGGSASASEIVAGALQDHRRA
ncbi:MAG: S41 family peptidase, partial [Pseudomonadota bacterium]